MKKRIEKQHIGKKNRKDKQKRKEKITVTPKRKKKERKKEKTILPKASIVLSTTRVGFPFH